MRHDDLGADRQADAVGQAHLDRQHVDPDVLAFVLLPVIVTLFSTTEPTPGRAIVVPGVGLALIGTAADHQVDECEPVASAEIWVAVALVLATALMVVAVISPLSRLRPAIVEVLETGAVLWPSCAQTRCW